MLIPGIKKRFRDGEDADVIHLLLTTVLQKPAYSWWTAKVIPSLAVRGDAISYINLRLKSLCAE